jgi:hypothetical protein
MKAWLRKLLGRLWRWLNPPPDRSRELTEENRLLRDRLYERLNEVIGQQRRQDYLERIQELAEAKQMAGVGPWRVSAAVIRDTDQLIAIASNRLNQPSAPPGGIAVRETAPITAQGATGDIELALQNVEWRREVNLSWLEFSRWGIQQIILISRLYFVKNPLIQRGINVTANYVFGRGVEVMSEDPDANEVLKEFFEDNKSVLGQAALADLHKRLQYDGQVFYAFFADEVDKGKVAVRTIDATEIFEVITDPDDADCPQLYHRKWTQKKFDYATGQVAMDAGQEAYYPALNWEPDEKPEEIDGHPVMWDIPVLHQKGGIGVGKWHFDTPKAYAALDWARNARRLLEVDLSTRMALSQIAMTITTKGGQQALEGAKQQLGTTVGPTSNLWDMNPPAVAGATFASGPGTTLSAFNTAGAIRDPSDVKEYRAMVGMVFEIPPTFLGDMETANLATATTLDRPTELAMNEKQERWREVLITIASYVLQVNQVAPSGKLKESKAKYKIVECKRIRKPNGSWIYEASQSQPKDQIQIKCNFPSIREGDMPQIVTAISTAMTLGNKAGQVIGIDEKAGVTLLGETLGIPNWGDTVDEMYPDTGPDKYDPSRTKEPVAAPLPLVAPPLPGGVPQAPGGHPTEPAPGAAPAPPPKAVESMLRVFAAVQKLREKKQRANTK